MADNRYFRLQNGALTPDITFDHTLINSANQKAALAGPPGYTLSDSDRVASMAWARALIDGLDWQESITHGLDYVKAGTPIGVGALNGEKCLDTTNKKLHTFTGGAWDAGVAITSLRFCHNTTGNDVSGDAGTHTASNNIYTADASDNITTISPDKGTAALFEDDDIRREYNGSIWVLFDSGSNHNSLSGKQGGNGTDEFYHLRQAQYNGLEAAASPDTTNPVQVESDLAKVPVRYEFIYKGGFAAGQTDVEFEDTSGSRTRIVMPKDGWFVATAFQSDSPRTGGLLDAEPTVDGTKITPSGLDLQLNGVETQADYASVALGTADYDFNAGQEIGVKVTSDGSWTTTSGVEDLVFDLLVAFD